MCGPGGHRLVTPELKCSYVTAGAAFTSCGHMTGGSTRGVFCGETVRSVSEDKKGEEVSEAGTCRLPLLCLIITNGHHQKARSSELGHLSYTVGAAIGRLVLEMQNGTEA